MIVLQNNNNLHIFVTKTIWNYIRKTTWSDTINLLSSIILSRAAHSSSSLNGSAECSLFRCSFTFSTESDCACSLSNNRNNDALKSFSLKIHVQNQIYFQNSELYKIVCERKYPFQCRIPIATQFCTNKSGPLPPYGRIYILVLFMYKRRFVQRGWVAPTMWHIPCCMWCYLPLNPTPVDLWKHYLPTGTVAGRNK